MGDDILRACNKCGGLFPENTQYFRKHKHGVRGLSPLCVPCNKKRDREYYHKLKGDPESHLNKYREYADGYRLYISRVLNQHKLREQDLRDFMDRQRGCCKICGKSLVNPLFNKSDMHIDHNHTSGVVRGLLCCNCNHLVGVCLEDTSILRNTIEYIEENK